MSSTQYLLFEVRGEVAVELGCINPGRGWGSAVVAIGDAEGLHYGGTVSDADNEGDYICLSVMDGTPTTL